MKSYHLIIQSRNQKSIKAFLSFFFDVIQKLNFSVIKKYFNRKKKKKVLTILKSPHVNKKAQEQFELRYFSKQISLYSSQSFRYLIFLKKIKLNLFPDVRIKTKLTNNKTKVLALRKQIFNPNNFHIKMKYNEKKHNLNFQNKKILKTKNYEDAQNKLNRASYKFIKILSIYGEF